MCVTRIRRLTAGQMEAEEGPRKRCTEFYRTFRLFCPKTMTVDVRLRNNGCAVKVVVSVGGNGVERKSSYPPNCQLNSPRRKSCRALGERSIGSEILPESEETLSRSRRTHANVYRRTEFNREPTRHQKKYKKNTLRMYKLKKNKINNAAQ